MFGKEDLRGRTIDAKGGAGAQIPKNLDIGDLRPFARPAAVII